MPRKCVDLGYMILFSLKQIQTSYIILTIKLNTIKARCFSRRHFQYPTGCAWFTREGLTKLVLYPSKYRYVLIFGHCIINKAKFPLMSHWGLKRNEKLNSSGEGRLFREVILQSFVTEEFIDGFH